MSLQERSLKTKSINLGVQTDLPCELPLLSLRRGNHINLSPPTLFTPIACHGDDCPPRPQRNMISPFGSLSLPKFVWEGGGGFLCDSNVKLQFILIHQPRQIALPEEAIESLESDRASKLKRFSAYGKWSTSMRVQS